MLSHLDVILRRIAACSGIASTLKGKVNEMSRVVEVSRRELEARRQVILDRLGTTYDELRERLEASALVGEEWDAWEELCDIDFLLGDA